MPQIVDNSYFKKANFLYIPLSVTSPVANTAMTTPDRVLYIDNLCVEIEKDLLLNTLGVSMYDELQLALADLNNPLYANYKKLVEGSNYNNKIWKGLKHEYSLIACKIFEEYLRRTNERLTGVGNVYVNPEKSENMHPNNLIVRANQLFIKQYQERALFEPKVINNTLDWLYLENTNEVSYYRFLSDNAVDFPLWDPYYFKLYKNGIVNSFGI